MSEAAESIRICLKTPAGEVAVTWDDESLRRMASGQDVAQPWRLEGDIDWSRWASLTVLSSAYEDGSVLALASLRPRGASGHDGDIVEALHGGPDSPLEPLEDVLPSLQRGEGALERFNLEASATEGRLIVRAAGDVESTEDVEPITRNILRMRMGGAAGYGTLDILSRP